MLEETFAIIKPDAFGKPWIENVLEKNDAEAEEPGVDENGDPLPAPAREEWKTVQVVRAPDMGEEIIKRIEAAGFEIVKRKTMLLTPKDAGEFYAEHNGKPFYPGLVKQMTSDLCLVMVLRKVDAIKQWRALMGPTNPDAARAAAEAEHPLDDSQWSLRALFGTAGPKNATHGSDSPFSALREINLFFPSSSHVYERTALFVTAEAAANVGAITAALEGDSFIVAAHATVTLSAAQAKAFAPDAAAALSQGPAVCLVVEGFNAALRLVLRTGPAVSVAKANIPSSLRALFGSSDSAPGVVPAPNALAAAEWIAASFPAPLPLERTLALIKPGVAATYGAVITRELANSGFTILAEARVTMSAEQARTLYAEHAEKPFFDTLVRYMTSDDVIALALEKPAAIRSLQVILGPTSPDVAAREAKHTLRGRFGSTTLANAVHGSSSIAAANREICSFFPSLHPTPLLAGAAAVQYLKAAPAADGKTLHHTLVEGLTALCKTKPAGLDAVRFLGEWLIANNPRNKDAGSDSKFDGPAAASAPIATMTPAAPALSVVFVLGGDDSTAGLCERLGKQFRFSVIKSSSTSTTAPSACLVELKDAIAQKGGSRFIVHGFPHTLEQAFAFERAIAQPLFVLLDGAEGPVADLYAKVGAAHAISGSGESAYASASKYFYPRVVFALGLPGCGRKKVSEALQASHGYRRLNLDELIDAEAASGSVFGRDIARTVALGDQLPSEWVIRLFQEAIDYDPTGCFIVDGYPRTVEQASEFAAAIAPPRFVLHLGVSEDEALRRMGAGAKKGIRVFKGRTQRYIDLMATLGLVRYVDASRPLASVISDSKRHFDPDVCFVLGGPGCGKGTQCERLVAQHKFVHLSAGDLLRAEIARGSSQGTSIKALIERGLLVPVDVTLTLLKAAMKTSAGDRFLVDGFPRAMDQAAVFEQAVCHPSRVLFLDVPDDIMTKRLLHRGLTSGRGDDNAETIKHRLKTFHDQSLPVIDRYSAEGKVALIDGTGTVAQVSEATDAEFRTRVVVLSGGAHSNTVAYGRQLAARFGYILLSVQSLIDAEIALGSARGKALEQLIKEDNLLPSEICDLIASAMERTRKQKFIVEGFPRNDAEMSIFESEIGQPHLWIQLDHAKDGRSSDLSPVFEQFTAQGRFLAVNAQGAPEDVLAQAKVPFQPHVVLLVGSAGSGRGEFARRAGKAFGFARLRVTHLLRAEVATGSALGVTIGNALDAKRTVPVAATLAVIKNAITASSAKRFLVDGFPRVVSDGFPSVQDQLFAFEDEIGPVRNVIVLEAAFATRVARYLPAGAGPLTPGQLALLEASTEVFAREKSKVLGFFEKLGKVAKFDTSSTADEVFAAAQPYLL